MSPRTLRDDQSHGHHLQQIAVCSQKYWHGDQVEDFPRLCSNSKDLVDLYSPMGDLGFLANQAGYDSLAIQVGQMAVEGLFSLLRNTHSAGKRRVL